MIIKKSTVGFLTLVLVICVPLIGFVNQNKTQNSKKDFFPIFDGKTLNNWDGDSTYWSVINGNLVGEVTPNTILQRNSFIIWRGGLPENFELKLEYRVSKNGNSGINYRSQEIEGVPFALKGYQCDIDGANNYTGQNYEERGRTTLAYRGQKVTLESLSDSLADLPLKTFIKNNAWTKSIVTETLGSSEELNSHIKNEDWNICHLIVKGNRMQHFVNGFLMSDLTDKDLKNRKMKGLIGVQVHVGPPMKIEFRNIKLKIL